MLTSSAEILAAIVRHADAGGILYRTSPVVALASLADDATDPASIVLGDILRELRSDGAKPIVSPDAPVLVRARMVLMPGQPAPASPANDTTKKEPRPMGLTAEQLELRRTGITSTDIVRLAGESPYGNACDVYAEKLETAPRKTQTLAMSLGHRAEPIICDLLAEHFGVEHLPATTVRHPTFEWVLSTPDRLVANDACMEAKYVGIHMAPRWSSDDAPPDDVVLQSQWHMTATGRTRCYVGALIGTEFRPYLVEHDADLSAALVELAERFWKDHVLAKVPPPVDGSESARRMLAAVWPRGNDKMLRAGVDADNLARAYFEASERVKAAEAEKAAAQNALCELIADHDGITGDGWRALWKWREPVEIKAFTRKGGRHFDLKALKEKSR